MGRLFALVLLLASAVPAAAGQSRAAFDAWASDPQVQADLSAFADYLSQEGVGDVLPLWQLTRTATDWDKCVARCGPVPFDVPPREVWRNIVATLRFVGAHVAPATGPLEAVSGFRNDCLNTCSGGRPLSAHRQFYALDLVPTGAIDRATLVARLCRAHARHGPAHRAGLGFYEGLRFHIDTKRFRRWGADGRGATSPCDGKP